MIFCLGKKISHRLFIVFFISLIVLATEFSFVSAQNTINLQTPLPGTQTTTLKLCEGEGVNLTCGGIMTYVMAAYQWLLVASGILGVVALMWAGLLWQSSRGDKKQIQDARGIISNALVGMGLLLSSYLILFIVNPDFVTLNPLNLGQAGNLKKIDLKITIPKADPYEPNLLSQKGPGTCNTPSVDGVPLLKQGAYGDYIAGSGCGITSFTMVANFYSKNTTPPSVLAAAGGTTAASYPGLASHYGLKTAELRGGYSPDIDGVKKTLVEKKPIMWYSRNPAFTTYMHWMVITGYDPTKNIFHINDPATGCIREATEADIRFPSVGTEGGWNFPVFYVFNP